MSILLVDPPTELGEALITRLVRQGDEVRVVERNPSRASLWTRLGAHVARGDPTDDDLIERAATNCRSVVTFTDDAARMKIAADSAHAALVSRMIAVVQKDQEIRTDIEVVMLVARPKGLLRKTIAPELLATAIDAADDIVELPDQAVDLNEADAWALLGLERP